MTLKMLNNKHHTVLFDKNFVADSVREILKCSSCRCHFSANYEVNRATSKIKGNRPVLLPCAHSMCENCIQQNFKNLVCPICSRPIQLPIKYLEDQREFKFHSVFEINFFLMGTLRQLQYFRRDKPCDSSILLDSDVSSVSRRAFGSQTAAAASSNIPNCNECDKSNAAGKCAACPPPQNFLCKPCFAKIHENVKILKSHKLIHWDKLVASNAGFYLPYLPKPEFCKIHKQKHCDQYCQQCNKIICYICAKNKHQKHTYVSLERRNANYIDGIHELFEAVKQSTEQVRKAQRELKSVESQFQEYASQTLESIAQYFWEIHGLLQLEFRQIMQSFSDSCQAPQNQIRGALQKLNQSQVDLNKIRTTLESFKETMPNNIDLAVVNNKIADKLNNLQCQANVTKITENPFIFQKKCDFKNELKNLYSIQYKAPMFSLHLSSMYGSRPPSMYPDSYAESSEMEQSMAASDENIEPAMISNADDSMMGGGGGGQAMKSQNIVKLMKEPTLIEQQRGGGGILARVSDLVSPTFFYVQKQDLIPQLAALSKKYAAMADSKHLMVQNFKRGQIYMGFDEQRNQWQRVMITKELNKKKCKAFLVDIGNEVEIMRKNVRKLDSDYVHIETAAIACGIYNIEPNGDTWPSNIKDIFYDVMRGEPVLVQKIAIKENNIWLVDLFTTFDENYPISMREAFLYMGLAREKPGLQQMSSKLKRMPLRAPIKLRLARINLNSGQTLQVKVSYIENPTEFFVVREEDGIKKLQMRNDLNTAYTNANPNEGKWVIHLGLLNMCCAVFFQDVWQRGVIEEIEENGFVRVRFVDEGNIETIKWNQVFHLAEQFREAKQFAIKCSLDEIEPFRKDNYTWSERAISEFELITKNPNIWLTVQHISNGVPKVALSVHRKNAQINCGALLVRRGLALSIGSTTQTDAITTHAQLNSRTLRQQEQIAECLADNAQNLALKSLSQQQQQVPRTTVTITYIVNPGEFYLYLSKLNQGIERFHAFMQEETEKRIDSTDNDDDEHLLWSLGDHCLVHTTVKTNEQRIKLDEEAEYKWYRGIIVDNATTTTNQNDQSDKKYSVFLRDIGCTVHDITSSQLYAINEKWDSVANTAARCHLAGLQPTGDTDTWSMSAKDCFRNNLKTYDTLLATLVGEQVNGSMPVVMWGMTVEDPDPLAPCVPKYSNINRILVSIGLAKLTKLNLKNGQYLDIETSENEIGIEEWLRKFIGDSFLDAIERCVTAAPSTTRDNKGDDDDEMLSVGSEQIYSVNDDIEQYLEEIDTTPTWGKLAPKAWLKSKEINKTLFTAYPTYVDYDASIYLHESHDDVTLKSMRSKLMKIYKNLQYDKSLNYSLGQPCIVKYHLDSKFYRGIIMAYDNRTDEYQVKFIDYGNEEKAQSNELLPFAPFPNLHAYGSKYYIDLIAPVDGSDKFSITTLDAMHALLVEKLVSVRVREVRKNLQYCSIRIGSDDFAELLIANKCAIMKKNDNDDNVKPNKKNVRKLSLRRLSANIDAHLLDQMSEVEQQQFELDKRSDGQSQSLSFLKRQQIHSDSDDDYNETIDVTGMDDDAEINRDMDFMLKAISDDDRLSHPCFFQSAFETDVQGPVGIEYFNEIQQNDDKDVDEHVMGESASGAGFNTALISSGGQNLLDETDADVVVLEESFINSYWKGFSANNKEHKDMDRDDEQKLAMQWNEIRSLQQAKEESSNEYEQFTPQDWSSSMSSIANLDIIRWPALSSNIRSFQCTIDAVLSPTQLHIFPHLDDFFDREMLLKKMTHQLAKTAPPLTTFTPNTLCLACYSLDQKWYRAIIRSCDAESTEAKIMFIDYWNSQDVLTKHLKICPTELAMLPLRTIKVEIYGVKPSPRMRTRDVMRAVREVVYETREPFVQVQNICKSVQRDGASELLPSSPNESYLVNMFPSENSTSSIFQCLVDTKYFVPTK